MRLFYSRFIKIIFWLQLKFINDKVLSYNIKRSIIKMRDLKDLYDGNISKSTLSGKILVLSRL